MSDLNTNLDNPDLNVPEYFKQYIKEKKIEELISTDNKLFSEVRNLESEKHVLVTQNYKKFVSATETINNIKSSLLSFENDLHNLQGKIQNLVSNFNTINEPLDNKLKESEEIYKIKKDLKRLKFINDLPNILETQLKLYLNDNEKNLSHLEKSLNYFDKCKEFLKIHKNNSLVKDIFSRTNELIYKYKSYINENMNNINIIEFNEFEIEKFEKCLGLLVKIEDDKNELIKIFINRYEYLIKNKFDKIFSLQNGVDEISFDDYSKIYDNYEFGLNENNFLFYENEIKENNNINNNNNNNNKNLNLSNLNSKFFKKGTFIWICKNICENLLNSILFNCYNSFKLLFGNEENCEILNTLFVDCIENFNEKVKNFLEKYNYNKNNLNKDENNNNNIIVNNDDKKNYDNILDPVFFKEGILCFYKNFLIDLVNKIEDKNLDFEKDINLIISNNNNLLNIYIDNIYQNFLYELNDNLKNKINNIIKQNDNNNNNNNNNINNLKEEFYSFNKSIYLKETEIFSEEFQKLLIKYSLILNNLNLDSLKENNNLIEGKEINEIYKNHLLSIFYLFLMSIQSTNSSNFFSNSYENYFNNIKNNINNDNIISNYKNIILNSIIYSKETLFYFIYIIKNLLMNNNLKILIEKYLNNFPQLKKNNFDEIKNSIEIECSKTLLILFKSIIHFNSKIILPIIKQTFFETDFIKINESPATFRLSLKKLCFFLFQLKIDLMNILNEESKNYKEKNIINDSNKIKSAIQIEMEKLQIRRLSFYNEKIETPQNIIYNIAKILLKSINEFVKLKKFSNFGYQQIQIDVAYIQNFFKKNFIFVDVENILEGFHNEIIKNCAFNTINDLNNNVLSNDLINDIIQLSEKEFNEIKNKFNNENNN